MIRPPRTKWNALKIETETRGGSDHAGKLAQIVRDIGVFVILVGEALIHDGGGSAGAAACRSSPMDHLIHKFRTAIQVRRYGCEPGNTAEPNIEHAAPVFGVTAF